MKTNLLLAIVTSLSILFTACSQDQDSPLADSGIAATKTYTPGNVHTPIIGCDTLTTPLITPQGGINYPIGVLHAIRTETDLHFLAIPNVGLHVRSMEVFEGEYLSQIPLDGNGTPDFTQFTYSDIFTYGKVSHSIAVPLSSILPCQAYSVHATIVMLNSQGGLMGQWDVWGWGHDIGDGSGMEICVLGNCSGGSFFFQT